MTFLFGDPEKAPKTKATRAVRNLATPAAIGSGPEGKTCGDCQFLVHVQHRAGRYLKCGKMEKHWTHGEGTDIRAKWEACSQFKQKGESDE